MCTLRDRPGFALVLTISLMVLLVLVAVGLLTLSSTTLRASTKGAAAAEARNNTPIVLNTAAFEDHPGPMRPPPVSSSAANFAN